jgi:phenylacetate-coenzyme A ligase PaaK-like adenylate-forming protein
MKRIYRTASLGRSDELVRLPSGRVLHPRLFEEVVFIEPAVRQYQIAQTAPAHFHFSLVAARDADRKQMAARLARRLEEAAAEPVTSDFVFLERLERPPGGKIPTVRALPGSE